MTFRTRFAPSPTGFLHIGSARTALFCYLQARREGGTLLLRIEDTDLERSKQEAVDVILEGLAWMGLSPDEPPVYQSQRHAQHREAALRLLAEGKAYRCVCTREELDAMREEQREKKLKPKYDGRCRHRQADIAADAPAVVRFITPADGEVGWDDLIQGTIRFKNEELDDLILLRSDGSPTYNLAVVVDDHDMAINHVIRGEDHISNTPRQIHLFRALGWEVPQYGHMPLLHGSDGAKLSKRHGAVSVLQFREDGYLPEALNNYLVRLGWSHGEQEIFTMAEMERLFDVRQLGRSASIFDHDKLLWINGHHIRAAEPERLAGLLTHQLHLIGIADPDPELVRAVIPALQPRAKSLREMAESARFYFAERVTPYQEKAVGKHLKAEILPAYQALLAALQAQEAWRHDPLEATFKEVMEAHGLAMGKLAQPVRIALTGTDVSPSIFAVLEALGRERSLTRLAELADFWGRL
ncbi:MAG: glutamate--tRNA ligase [Magnetococcales bacterium]|nr:glutamate--tRNA ligase [Magnetococcales bacterium]